MTSWRGAFRHLDSHQKELVVDALVLVALELRAPLSDAERRGVAGLLEELAVALPGHGDRAFGAARDRLSVARCAWALGELARSLAEELQEPATRRAILAATTAVAAMVAPVEHSPSNFLGALKGAFGLRAQPSLVADR